MQRPSCCAAASGTAESEPPTEPLEWDRHVRPKLASRAGGTPGLPQRTLYGTTRDHAATADAVEETLAYDPRMDASDEQRDSMAFPMCQGEAVPWVTVAQMRDVDRVAIEMGLTLPRMMENAGANLARLARSMLGGDTAGRRVVALAGRGGNGGGGLVAARRLIGFGADVEVRLAVEPGELAPVPREQLKILRAMGARITVGADRLSPPELFIDAILGYSQQGSPRGAAAELVVASQGATVLSLDVPTGLDLGDASANEPAIRATATLTLASPKSALGLDAASALVGDLYLGDISIPAAVYERLGIPYSSPFTRDPIVRLV